MKTQKILYWVVTILFAGFMIFTAIDNVRMSPESVTLISDQLGYPKYFVFFIGLAKLLGSLAILIPGLYRIKEWAYAGLFFDLAGALYSAVATWGFDVSMLFLVLPIALLFISYFLWHKITRGLRPAASL